MLTIRCLAPVAVASCLLACSSRPTSPPDGGGCITPVDGGNPCDATIPKAADCAAPQPEAGTPTLAALSVTSGSDSNLALVPDFSPGIYDYYVRCSAGTNTLEVSLKAATGASGSLVGAPGCDSCFDPTGQSPAASQTVTVNVAEGQAIVAEATMGTSSQQYWVRCLPQDFPQMKWEPHANGCERAPGYYLWGVLGIPEGVSGYAIILDTNGVPVWFKDNGSPIYDLETLKDGDVSYAVPWQFDQLSPPVSSPVLAGGMPPDEHELRLLPNGNFLGISSASQTGVNLTGLTIPLYDGGVMTYGPNGTILACNILEFEPSGNIVWQWTATDHFDPVTVMALRTPDLAQPTVEPFHCNSIDVDPATGNLLVSARDMNSVFYIDRATSKVLWKMGGPNSSKDGAAYIDVASPFVGQHDARLVAGWSETATGGSGQVSVFDDESFQSVPARGVIYDVKVGGPGSTGTATVAWEYKNWMGYAATVTGSMRVTADGSRIIGWGQSEPNDSPLLFTETDDKGNDLLDMLCPDYSSSYRAVKAPLTAFSLPVLRNTSQ